MSPTKASRLRKSHSRRRRLALESLEDRVVLSVNPITYTSTDIPVAIPDNDGGSGHYAITSLQVPDSFRIADVNATLQINHTFDSDLAAFLRNPSGTFIRLFGGVGGSGDNFNHTTFDDEAATSITSGTAPFAGTYRPDGAPLSTYDGTNAIGTWQLYVGDYAAGDTGSVTGWSLTFTPVNDDFANVPAYASTINLAANGSGSQSGQIEYAGDTDVFRITSPVTNDLYLSDTSRNFYSQVNVRDSNGTLVTQGFIGFGNTVRLSATAGQTYFVSLNEYFNTSTGAYNLRIAPDVGDTQATAQAVTLAADGSGIVNNQLDFRGDADAFSFTAPVRGVLNIADTGGETNAAVSVLDSSGATIAQGRIDFGSSLNVFVNDGQTYTVVMHDQADTYYGLYSLHFQTTPDDYANTIGQASPVTLAADGTGTQAGVINYASDVDYFKFIAATDGRQVIRENAAPGSSLDSYLVAYDANGTQLDANNDFHGTDSLVSFDVVAGQTYYVRAGAYGSSTGGYGLAFGMDVGDAQATARPLTLAADGSGLVNNTLEFQGDVDAFTFTAPVRGVLNIADTGTDIDATVTVLDSTGATVAQDTFIGFGSSLNAFVNAGQSYTVLVHDYFDYYTGNYSLHFQTTPDDYANTMGQASTVTLAADGTATQAGVIDYANDVDYFKFTAATDGRQVIRENAAPGSSLDSYLVAYDANGTQLAANDDFHGSDSLVSFDVVAGQTYFIRAGAYGSSTGGYGLTFGMDVGDTQATARPLTLAADGSGVVNNTLEFQGDVDAFTFTAPVRGLLNIADTGTNIAATATVLDSTGATVAQDTFIGFGSSLNVVVNPGQSYTVVIHDYYDYFTGDYSLHFQTTPDDYGDTMGQASTVTLAADGTATQAGVIDYANDVDYFRFTAANTGRMIVQENRTASSSLDSYLYAYDANGTQLDANDDFNGTNSQVGFDVVAGQTYYVRAGAFGSSTGGYSLLFQTLPDDYANTRAQASLVTLAADGSAMQAGVINYASDVDYFRFSAAVTGRMIVQENAIAGSSLDSSLIAYDASGTQLAANDDFNGSTDSQVAFYVVAGQTYYLRAGAFGSSTGGYGLTLATLVDAYGNTAATAFDLPSGDTSINGAIEQIGDVDYFRYTATTTGQATVRVNPAVGSALDPYLSVYDVNQRLLAFNDDASSNRGSLVRVNVVAGQTYFFRVEAFGPDNGNSSTSGYTLDVGVAAPLADDHGDEFDDATQVANPFAHDLTGIIGQAADVDMFEFTAAADGHISVRLEAATVPGSLVPYLYILNSDRQVVATNYGNYLFNNPTTDDLHFDAVAGQNYYVRVAGFRESKGAYYLSIQPDDYLGPLPFFYDNQAKRIDLTGTGANLQGHIDAAIELPGDADIFKFTPTQDGVVEVRMEAAYGSMLDSYLFVYNGEWLYNDDIGGDINPDPNVIEPNLDSSITLAVNAGQTYYIWATTTYNYNSSTSTYDYHSTGAYSISIRNVVDDYGNNFPGAYDLTLAADNSLATPIHGRIGYQGDSDFFSFVAQSTGTLVIRQDAAAGGNLDTYLNAYRRVDGTGGFGGSSSITGELIASNNDSGTGTNSRLTIDVVAGQTYFIEASSLYGQGIGDYTLSIAPLVDDFGNDIAHAHTINLGADGSATQSGELERAGDSDYFHITASFNGQMTIHLDATGGNFLDTYLYVYDAGGNLIASNDDSGGTLNSALTLNVTSGTDYYIRAGSYGNYYTGLYTLTFARAVDDFGNDIGSATDIALAADGTGSQNGTIDYGYDSDFFRIAPAFTGSLTIRQAARAGSYLDSYLYVYDANGNQIASADGDGSSYIDSQLTVDVTQGATYYVRAAGYYSSTGAYALTFGQAPAAAADDFGNDFGSAHAIALAADNSGTQAGVIETAFDNDYFSFSAQASGQLTIRQSARSASGLDSYLYVYDANQVLLAVNDDSDGLNSQVTVNVVAGNMYYVRAAAYSSSTGAYNLTFGDSAANATQTTADDYGNSTAAAAPIPLTVDNTTQAVSGSISGNIETVGDSDYFSFVAASSGQLAIRQSAASDSVLDSYLYVYDGGGNFLAANDDSDGTLNSRVTVVVTQGQTYYVRATAYGYSTGRYDLTIATAGALTNGDHVANTFAGAELLTADNSGVAVRTGEAIDTAGDIDVYRYVASDDGILTINQEAVSSNLDCYVYVYDGNYNYLGADDDSGDGLNSRLQIHVAHGQTYYIIAAAYGYTTGAYQLTASLATDDWSDTPSGAVSVNVLNKSGFDRFYGRIDTPNDTDVIRIQATRSAGMEFRLQAIPGSNLDDYLFIYDSAGNLLGHDSGTMDANGDCTVRIHVTAGQEYFIQIAAEGASRTADEAAWKADQQNDPNLHRYRVVLTPLFDDFRDELVPSASTLTAATGNTATGVIEVAGDTDVFRFQADTTGRVTVRMSGVPGSGDAAGYDALPDTFLTVYDANGRQLGQNDDADAQHNSAVTISVEAGSFYYVRAQGYGQFTGAYQVLVVAADASADDYGNTFDTAQVLSFLDDGSALKEAPSGAIQPTGDVDVFQVVAAQTGSMTFQLTDVGSALLGSISVYTNVQATPDSPVFRTQIGHQTASAAGSPVSITIDNVVAGQTFWVRIEGAADADGNGTQGSYTLHAANPAGAIAASNSAFANIAQNLADHLTSAFTDFVARHGLTPETASAVRDSLVQEFIASQGGQLPTDYLILYFDPVDAIVTDAAGRQIGQTASTGQVNEIAGATYSRGGVLDLLIIPNALASDAGQFTLSLIGVGSDPVLFNYQLVQRDGNVRPVQQLTVGGQEATGLPAGPISKDGLQVVLDFLPQQGQGPGQPPEPGPGQGPGTVVNTPPSPAPAPIVANPTPSPTPESPVPAPAPIVANPTPSPTPESPVPGPAPAPIVANPTPSPTPESPVPAPAPAPIVANPTPSPVVITTTITTDVAKPTLNPTAEASVPAAAARATVSVTTVSISPSLALALPNGSTTATDVSHLGNLSRDTTFISSAQTTVIVIATQDRQGYSPVGGEDSKRLVDDATFWKSLLEDPEFNLLLEEAGEVSNMPMAPAKAMLAVCLPVEAIPTALDLAFARVGSDVDEIVPLGFSGDPNCETEWAVPENLVPYHDGEGVEADVRQYVRLTALPALVVGFGHARYRGPHDRRARAILPRKG